jgi:hypothetical protein
MAQPGPRQTKKQKKSLAFRTRQKTGKKKVLDDEDAMGLPVDENQDLAGLAGLPLEAEEISAGGKSGGRKGKAQDIGHHQPQPDGSKKRKTVGEDVFEEKPQKRTKAQPVAPESAVEDDDCQKAAELKKEVQPQRFILFIGTFSFLFASQGSALIHRDRRQFKVLHDKGCYSRSLFFMRYGELGALLSIPWLTRSRQNHRLPFGYPPQRPPNRHLNRKDTRFWNSPIRKLCKPLYDYIILSLKGGR